MIGETISHYKILDKLGEGGMGVVYKAQDTRLDRVVALKFLARHLTQDEEGRRRFIREAKAAASLDHSHICTVYEIDEASDQIFIAMAYVAGQGLNDRIAAGPQKLDEALDIAAQVAEGLQEAHRKGIVHRDIKPANVMVTSKASSRLHVTVMDFGLAQLNDRSMLTKADTTLGTIAYMSPEQTQGNKVDHRTDIWSLGVVLYEMVTGRLPFLGHYEQAIIYAILNEEPEPVTALRAGLPMELEWIVGKTLTKDPNKRYQSAAELLVDLQTLHHKVSSGKSTMLQSRSQATTEMFDTPAAGPPQPLMNQSAEVAAGDQPQAETTEDPRRKGREIRERLLELAGQGLLPDRILSKGLEIVRKHPGQLSSEQQHYRALLDELHAKQIPIGEFIDAWHQLESGRFPEPAKREAEPPGEALLGGYEYRAKTEWFGLPLIHIAHGIYGAGGRHRVARGIVAIGDVALGVLAVGGIAIGGLTIGGLSLGLVAVGGVALGLLLGFGGMAAGGAVARGGMVINVGDTIGPILILIGLVLLWRATRGRRRQQVDPEGAFVSGWVMFGGRETRSTATGFQGGNVFAMFGGYKIDLTGAKIGPQPARLEANAMFGGVEIRVPEDWTVLVRGAPIFGGYADKTRAPRQAKPGQQLIVNGLALFGGVEVKN